MLASVALPRGEICDARGELSELGLLLVQLLDEGGDAGGVGVQLLLVGRKPLLVRGKDGSGLLNLRTTILKDRIELHCLQAPEQLNPPLDLCDLLAGELRHCGRCELTFVSLDGRSFPRAPLDCR